MFWVFNVIFHSNKNLTPCGFSCQLESDTISLKLLFIQQANRNCFVNCLKKGFSLSLVSFHCYISFMKQSNSYFRINVRNIFCVFNVFCIAIRIKLCVAFLVSLKVIQFLWSFYLYNKPIEIALLIV